MPPPPLAQSWVASPDRELDISTLNSGEGGSADRPNHLATIVDPLQIDILFESLVAQDTRSLIWLTQDNCGSVHLKR